MSPTPETRALYESMRTDELQQLRNALALDGAEAESGAKMLFVARRIDLIDEVLEARKATT